ncbi:MAG TPA: ATP-binding cassette domain-containing protein [Candidatus Dormibacteraeota bacterium]|nr:ATP-binding cassette domain-containing protein [Candidatus Dormibacteraeota bacterium]
MEARSPGGSLLDVQGLTCIRRLQSGARIIAVRGLDLRLAAGERVALVGPAGCGKTTVLDVLAGLATPSAGHVHVFGRDLAELRGQQLDEYRRTVVGYQRQPAAAWLWPELSALENLQAAMLGGLDPAGARWQRAIDLLSALGLASLRGRRPGQLGAADLQRLALAMALANRPALLLADEPAGELDPEGGEEILADLDALLHELGTAAVLASCDIAVSHHADRMVWLAGEQDDLADTAAWARLPE